MDRVRWGETVRAVRSRVDDAKAKGDFPSDQGDRVKLGSPGDEVRLFAINLNFGSNLPPVNPHQLRKQLKTKLFHAVPAYQPEGIKRPRERHLPDLNGLVVSLIPWFTGLRLRLFKGQALQDRIYHLCLSCGFVDPSRSNTCKPRLAWHWSAVRLCYLQLRPQIYTMRASHGSLRSED